jgi:hypothetical protein
MKRSCVDLLKPCRTLPTNSWLPLALPSFWLITFGTSSMLHPRLIVLLPQTHLVDYRNVASIHKSVERVGDPEQLRNL